MKTFAALFLALVLSLRAEERHFIEFEGTASPDGRYAVAWSFPANKKVDWLKLTRGESHWEMTEEQQKYFYALLGDTLRKVENYIIDTKTEQPVLTLPNFDHWAFRDTELPRSDIHAAWTPKGDMVVVTQKNSHWGLAAVTIVRLPKEAKPTGQDILKNLERLIEQAVSKKFSKDRVFQQDREKLVFSFSEFQFLDASRLGLHMEVYAHKDADDGFEYEADAVFSLRTTKTKNGTSLTCELVSLSSKQPASANTKTEPLKPAIKAPAR